MDRRDCCGPEIRERPAQSFRRLLNSPFQSFTVKKGLVARQLSPGSTSRESTPPIETTGETMASTKVNALQELIDGLQEDLSREYQAIIAYTVYSNVLTGAAWMSIAKELKKHAHEELEHALIIADQIDYLGAMPNAKAKEVKLSKKAEDMLRFDLDNETETIKAYRQRVKQAEVVGHFALAEQIRKIIAQEQEHQHDLATALGIEVPKVFDQGA
jgi:bacterioferritin